MVCNECGKEILRKYPGGICQGCYNYKRNGGITHELPPKGVIVKDNNGYIVCHICGRSYKRLGSHAKESHHLTIEQYKREFDLCRNARTTEDNYSETMKDLALKYKMDEMLKDKGSATRFIKGSRTPHTKDKVRLQEIIDKRNRKRGA